MKKTLLAAALLAGFATAGVAQAETSVTLYGIVDTGYGYQNYRMDRAGVDFHSRSSGSRQGAWVGNRWGMRGSEDLGDGLRAIFTLEAGFNLDNGGFQGPNNQVFARQAWVGLSGDDWGSFTIGRQYGAGVSSNVADNGIAMGAVDRAAGAIGISNRISNSFKYTTPNFGGFTGQILYATANQGSRHIQNNGVNVEDRGSRVSVGGTYVNGPLKLGASYDREAQYGIDPNGEDFDAVTGWHVSGSYDFEVVRVSAVFEQDRHGKLGWLGAAGGLTGMTRADLGIGGTGPLDPANTFNGFKSNTYGVALTAPLAGGRAGLFYKYSSSNLDDSDKLDNKGGNISSVQLDYLYPLSKRTTIYTYATYMNNASYIKGLKGTEAGLGINHKF